MCLTSKPISEKATMNKFRIVSLVVASLVVAGCSEKGGNPPAGNQPAAAVSDNQPTAQPSGPQFAIYSETQDGLASRVNGGVCSVENVVTAPDGRAAASDTPNTYQVDRNTVFRMVGFAVNKDKDLVPADIEIVLTGNKTYSLKSNTGGDREDVGKFFGNPAFAKAGFMQDASFAAVEPGEYAMYVVSTDGDMLAVCPTHQGIRVL